MIVDLARDAYNRLNDAKAREQRIIVEVTKLRGEHQSRQLAIGSTYASKKDRVKSEVDKISKGIKEITVNLAVLQTKQTKIQKQIQELQSQLSTLQSTQTSVQNRLSDNQKMQNDYFSKLQQLQNEEQIALRKLDSDYKPRIDRLEAERKSIANRLPSMESDYINAQTRQNKFNQANSNFAPSNSSRTNLNTNGSANYRARSSDSRRAA